MRVLKLTLGDGGGAAKVEDAFDAEAALAGHATDLAGVHCRRRSLVLLSQESSRLLLVTPAGAVLRHRHRRTQPEGVAFTADLRSFFVASSQQLLRYDRPAPSRCRRGLQRLTIDGLRSDSLDG